MRNSVSWIAALTVAVLTAGAAAGQGITSRPKEKDKAEQQARELYFLSAKNGRSAHAGLRVSSTS